MAKFKPKTEYTPEQKVKAFDALQADALAIYAMHREAIESGRGEPFEKEHDRIFELGEAVLAHTLGKTLFQHWDKP